MPDISMCSNEQCPSRESCHRFTAETNGEYQWYAEFRFDETGKCGWYIEGYRKEKLAEISNQNTTKKS